MGNDSSLALVRSELGRTARGVAIFGSVLVLLSAITFVFNEAYGTPGDMGAGRLTGAVFLLLGAFFVWVAVARLGPGTSAMFVALRERPGDVIWFYRQNVRVNGVDAVSCNIIVCMKDGRTATLNVPNARTEALMGAIRKLAPQAIEGFSPERATQYKRDPRGLT